MAIIFEIYYLGPTTVMAIIFKKNYLGLDLNYLIYWSIVQIVDYNTMQCLVSIIYI